jgi:ABC-type phosphate transport system substrate-binding protein
MGSRGASAHENLAILVNADNPTSQLSDDELRAYFLKKRKVWPNGAGVRFIDREPNSLLRKTFLKTVLHQTPEEVDMYWIGQKLYSGDSAPLQEGSETMIVQFVASFKGALAYVPASFSTSVKGVKVIPIEGD